MPAPNQASSAVPLTLANGATATPEADAPSSPPLPGAGGACAAAAEAKTHASRLAQASVRALGRCIDFESPFPSTYARSGGSAYGARAARSEGRRGGGVIGAGAAAGLWRGTSTVRAGGGAARLRPLDRWAIMQRSTEGMNDRRTAGRA